MKMTHILSFYVLNLFVVTSCSNGSNYTDEQIDTNSFSDTSSDSQSAALPIDGAFAQEVQLLYQRDQEEVHALFSTLQLLVPSSATLSSQIQSGIAVYKLTYHTTYKSEPISASALLALPTGVTAPIPILSFQNGTSTEYSEAPTQNPNSQTMRIINAVASLGYAVLVADYLGFGASTQVFHPYLCKEITVQTIIDMLLAAVELEESETLSFELSGDLFLVGYSQGGHATMAVHHYLESQPDFPLVLQATAAGAGPYNLKEVYKYVLAQDTYEQPYYFAYSTLAFKSMGFLTADLSLYFSNPYAHLIPGLFNGINSSKVINDSLTMNIPELFTPTLLDSLEDDSDLESMRNAFVENSILPFVSTIPIRLSQGTSDMYIPPSLTIAFQEALINAGSPRELIDYFEIPDKDHQSAAPFAITDAVQWFNELNGY